jgi:polyphosphate glucokinase
MEQKAILGIDIGGSGIKGALVDVQNGTFLTERLRIDTPSPATPKAVAKVFSRLVKTFKYRGLIGCGFPAVIKHGVAYSAANIDSSWINTNVKVLLEKASGQSVFIANDADLAGLAEMTYGAGVEEKYHKGTVLMITIGTGLGSALFYDGQLVPNTELGHFLMKNGLIAEHFASNQVRKNEALSWEAWGSRLNLYFNELDKLFSPDAILLGGGGSKYFEEIKPFISTKTLVVPSILGNDAGIIGAAVLAKQQLDKQTKKFSLN